MTEQKTICLANLHEATKQEVFDQVAKHLLTQKERSTCFVDGQCQYRGDGGLMCAAGCLIADSEYASSWEGYGWRSLVDGDVVSPTHMQLIQALQEIHDHIPVDNWYLSLKMLAFDNGLEFDAHLMP